MGDDPLAVLQRAPALLAPVAVAYDRRLAQWGPRARGVFWRNEEGQTLRFEVLCRLLAGDPGPLTINDLGCGYGAFFDYLATRSEIPLARFTGYDISEEMVAKARARISDPRAHFVSGLIPTEAADYSFASGTFNLNLDANAAEWKAYVQASLAYLWRFSRKGLAFNMLDGRDANSEGLFYAEPEGFVEFCRSLSPRVELATDYPLNEWTIFVRR